MTRDNEPLETVFALLDQWRHFPAYQLERRADVFFAVYLHEVMEGETGIMLRPTIIPELPLKRDLIWPERPSNQSVKVDYTLFAADLSKVLFVELKTDAASRRDSQDLYLERAQRLGFKRIVEGIREIVLATSAHAKYHHLVRALAELGFLSLPPDLHGLLYPRPRRGLSKRLADIEVADINPVVEIFYVQPLRTDGDRCVDFEAFASYVSKHDDPMSKLFALHLLRWVDRVALSS